MGHKLKVATILQTGQLLLAHGIAPAELLRRIELPPAVLLDGEAWIDRAAGFRLGEEISRVLNDPDLGLHAMELNQFEQFGSFGASILQSPSIGRALEHLAHNVSMMVTGLSSHLATEGREARFSLTYVDRLGGDPRHHVEANLLFCRTVLNLAVQHIPARIRLPYPRMHSTGEMERLLGPDLEFDADRPELVFDRDALRLPLLTSAPASIYGRPPTTPRETAGAVMRVLRSRIIEERPTAAAIAVELGINVRTMQRHLASWGLTFEMLLNEYRYRRAVEYLCSGDYSITDIAFLLGYSDSAHFTRAFRRWSGHAPRQHKVLDLPDTARAAASG